MSYEVQRGLKTHHRHLLPTRSYKSPTWFTSAWIYCFVAWDRGSPCGDGSSAESTRLLKTAVAESFEMQHEFFIRLRHLHWTTCFHEHKFRIKRRSGSSEQEASVSRCCRRPEHENTKVIYKILITDLNQLRGEQKRLIYIIYEHESQWVTRFFLSRRGLGVRVAKSCQSEFMIRCDVFCQSTLSSDLKLRCSNPLQDSSRSNQADY